VFEVQRVDYVRVPATDIQRAADFYGRVLGLRLNPNSPGDDWLEFEAGNVTLAVMTPHTHGYEFAPLPPGTITLRVADVDAAKAMLEVAGVVCGEVWDFWRLQRRNPQRRGRQPDPRPSPLRALPRRKQPGRADLRRGHGTRGP